VGSCYSKKDKIYVNEDVSEKVSKKSTNTSLDCKHDYHHHMVGNPVSTFFPSTSSSSLKVFVSPRDSDCNNSPVYTPMVANRYGKESFLANSGNL